MPLIGKPIVSLAHNIKRSIKQLVIPNMYFEDIGFTYLGPVDGHNIDELEKILEQSKHLEGPILIHVITKKEKDIDSQKKHRISFMEFLVSI